MKHLAVPVARDVQSPQECRRLVPIPTVNVPRGGPLMSRRPLAGAVGLAALVALAACVGREPQAPVRPEFGVQSGPGTEPTDCDFSNITSLVIAYFPGPRQNTVKDLVTAMETAGNFSA